MSGNFSFGNAATSGQSSGGLFGTANAGNSGSAAGSIFGNAGGSTGTTPNFSFGQPAKASNPGGTGNENKPGGLFGGGPGSSSIFGQQSGNSSADAKPSPFGQAGYTSQTPGTPSQPTTTKFSFGSTTPAPSNTSNVFGNPSTTPAGQPPAGSLFGASTGASTAQPEANTKPTFSFGKPAPPPPSNPAPTTQTSNLFGGQAQAPASSFFTPKADSSQPAPAGLFAPKPSGEASSSAPASTFFGTQTKPSNPPESNQSSNLFGGASKPVVGVTNNFFNTQKPAEPSSQTPAANAFSFPTTKRDETPPDQSASAPKSSIFNPTSTSSQPASSLFNKTTADSIPPTNNLFAKPAAPASQASEQPKSSGFSFPGLGKSSETPTTSAGTAEAPKPMFSGLGAGASNVPASTATTTATAAAATTVPAAAPASFFNLGGAKPSAPQTSTSNFTPGPAPAANTTAGGIGTLGASTLGASTTGPAPPAQSRLRNKTMDEILTRWASDLTRYTKEFKTHAETVAHWDQIIVDNSAKIDKLYVQTRTCEKQTMSVEMQLSAVENQQNELEAWLNKYENDVDEMLAKDGPAQNELGGPDQERERTYKLAERLGERLDDMGRNLQSMIEEVNAANASLGTNNKADEPITQIVRILNSHLSQLQAIDQGTSALQAKVAVAQRAASGVNYMNGSMNGDNRAAVDDFYRSYMGRR